MRLLAQTPPCNPPFCNPPPAGGGADIINPAISRNLGNFTTSGGGTTALQLFLRNIINVVFGVAGIIFFFMLIRGGYEYITAGADKEAVQRATKRLTTAFVGIALIFSVYALVFVIEALFGISLLSLNIPTI